VNEAQQNKNQDKSETQSLIQPELKIVWPNIELEIQHLIDLNNFLLYESLVQYFKLLPKLSLWEKEHLITEQQKESIILFESSQSSQMSLIFTISDFVILLTFLNLLYWLHLIGRKYQILSRSFFQSLFFLFYHLGFISILIYKFFGMRFASFLHFYLLVLIFI
jgi:hypothetical protein